MNAAAAISPPSQPTAMQPPSPAAEPDSGKLKKMPTDAELEEFFAAMEKNLHKQFIDKYNYDPVKDEPLEGRFEWVPIN